MQFNVSKCIVLHYGNSTAGYSYSINNKETEEVDCEKDLGITFSNDLKVATHCKEAYSKANCILGLISRTIKYRNLTTLTNLYKSLVRPHLDYCPTVWNPHYNRQVSDRKRTAPFYSTASSSQRPTIRWETQPTSTLDSGRKTEQSGFNPGI